MNQSPFRFCPSHRGREISDWDIQYSERKQGRREQDNLYSLVFVIDSIELGG